MATSARKWAVDTSVAVAALDSSHAAHQVCREAVRSRRPALSGHAAFETFSVLTRMPGELRIDPPVASAAIAQVFPTACWLDEASSLSLLSRVGELGVAGGAIYDALVGEAARVAKRTLLTRDYRARRTYDLLGVTYEIVGLPA
jgi:predicted nucleic acid-binding protein